MRKYQQISNSEDEETGPGSGIELHSIGESESDFVVKVLYKEAKYEVRGLTPDSTINDLKVKVFQLSDVPINMQRFIFQGRQMKPEHESLSHFNVVSNTNIHLFPIQAPPAATSGQQQQAGSNQTANPLHANNNHNNANNANNEAIAMMAIDPRLAEAPQAVKFWSMTLLVLSFMELFNNFAIMSTGVLGVSILDSIVTLSDTGCSILGVYVAQLGLKSVRTGDMTVVNEYVKWLTICAAACVIMRILWVVDLSFQMEAIRKDNNKKLREEQLVTDPNVDPNSSNQRREITERDVINFIIQASIIGLIIIYTWLKCVLRAYSFRTLVQSIHGAGNVGQINNMA